MSKLPKIDLGCYWYATGRAESARVNPFTRPLNPPSVPTSYMEAPFHLPATRNGKHFVQPPLLPDSALSLSASVDAIYCYDMPPAPSRSLPYFPWVFQSGPTVCGFYGMLIAFPGTLDTLALFCRSF